MLRACSFAIVIQQLPPQLRDAVCVFYLVLRALDTVEDDMAVAQEIKIPLLRAFHEKCYDRCGAPRLPALLLSSCCAPATRSAAPGAASLAWLWPLRCKAAGSCERQVWMHTVFCIHTSLCIPALMPALMPAS